MYVSTYTPSVEEECELNAMFAAEINTHVVEEIDMEGMMYVDGPEVEAAHLVLARATGRIEPLLYEHDTSPELYQGGEASLNMMVDIQERMATGMVKINEAQASLTEVKLALWNASNRKKVPYAEFTALLKAKADWSSRIAMYWDTWFMLQAESQKLAESVPSVWPQYYALESGEQNEWDSLAHKRSAPAVDSRMLVTDEAFFVGHMEEQEELFVYNTMYV
jgi:hypothetical protein